MNIIVSLISLYVLFTNVKFLENTNIIYVVLIVLLGFILLNKNSGSKNVFNNTLRLLLKFLMAFSIFIAILGLSKNYIKIDSIIYGFDKFKSEQAYQTGLVNFILCAISYFLIIPKLPDTRRRIR